LGLRSIAIRGRQTVRASHQPAPARYHRPSRSPSLEQTRGQVERDLGGAQAVELGGDPLGRWGARFIGGVEGARFGLCGDLLA
jgi:hypothetical protein